MIQFAPGRCQPAAPITVSSAIKRVGAYLIYNHKKKGFSLLGLKNKTNIINCKNNKFLYLFIGDTLGNLSVYKKSNENSYNINNEMKEAGDDVKLLSEIYNNYSLMKTLTDHTSEIKYIDYNPRLNLLIDYALDGYINLYTMPTLKLVLSIQIKDFDIKEIINYVVLLSIPFPMICCVTSSNIIVIDINGKLINKIKIEKGITLKFYIDKKYGLFKDYISSCRKNEEEKIIDLF